MCSHIELELTVDNLILSDVEQRVTRDFTGLIPIIPSFHHVEAYSESGSFYLFFLSPSQILPLFG